MHVCNWNRIKNPALKSAIPTLANQESLVSLPSFFYADQPGQWRGCGLLFTKQSLGADFHWPKNKKHKHTHSAFCFPKQHACVCQARKQLGKSLLSAHRSQNFELKNLLQNCGCWISSATSGRSCPTCLEKKPMMQDQINTIHDISHNNNTYVKLSQYLPNPTLNPTNQCTARHPLNYNWSLPSLKIRSSLSSKTIQNLKKTNSYPN